MGVGVGVGFFLAIHEPTVLAHAVHARRLYRDVKTQTRRGATNLACPTQTSMHTRDGQET